MIRGRNLDPKESKKNVEVTLSAGLANAISFAWQNPEKTGIMVTRVLMNITTAGGTASSVMDVGRASSATGTGDEIFNGVNINQVVLFDNFAGALYDTYTDGTAILLDANGGTNDFITGKILTQNASSLAGKVYIEYKTL